MEFSFTERDARKLFRNRYQYVKQKNQANGLTWEFIERGKGNCKAKVKLNAINDFVKQVQVHIHAPSATRYELTKVHARCSLYQCFANNLQLENTVVLV